MGFNRKKYPKHRSSSCAWGHPHACMKESPSIFTVLTEVHKSKSRKSTFTLHSSTCEKTIYLQQLRACSITCHETIVSVHAGAFKAGTAVDLKAVCVTFAH